MQLLYGAKPLDEMGALLMQGLSWARGVVIPGGWVRLDMKVSSVKLGCSSPHDKRTPWERACYS